MTTGPHAPYLPPPEDDEPAPPPERRRRDRRFENRIGAAPTVLSVVTGLVDNKLFVLAAAGLAFLGGRITGPGDRMAAIEQKLDAGWQRDSISIADRRELREAMAMALTLMGRAECRHLTPQEAADLGMPCALLRDGQIWPLFRRMQRDAAGPPAPPMPASATALQAEAVAAEATHAPAPRPAPPAGAVAVLFPVAPGRAPAGAVTVAARGALPALPLP